MRITDLIKYDNYVKNDQIRQNEIEKYSRQIATGKKLLSPSDDTVANATALRLKTINQNIDAYLRNMDFVSNVLDQAESTLSNITNAGQELRLEIVKLLNTGVLDKEDAETLRDYFVSMKDYIIKQANYSIGDTRIFGGAKSQTDPFDSNGYYQGETIETKAPIAPGVEINTTFDGSKYLGVDANDKQMIMVKTVDKIVDIIDRAIAGTGSLGELNTATISVNGEDLKILEAFDKGLNSVLQYTAVIGTQVKIIDNIKSGFEKNKVSNNNLISNLQDADTAEAITNLQKAQTAYQALIAVYNQNRQLSLLDFLK